ncbi:MAG: SDR family NAD(P)-dependent oxidoreductase [Verrucomicrobia bacterium]|nr:SDR family NAD(P)-dependent oxidoreductase [Verrucomicrobiota bacterium]
MSKHIAIIGGTSGIGRATITQLLAASHQVHVACRSPEKLADLGIVPQLFDASSPSPLSWPERLDGLVYFPGTIVLKPFHRLTAEDFQRDLQVNFFGAIAALQSALPALKASGNASVVLFSTVAVTQGMPMHASISAAKGAVEGLAKSLAAEWAPLIRVNVIAPSLTETPLASAFLNSELKKEAAAKRHPLQQVGQPEDIAAAVAHLLADTSRFMTGQVVRIDGGLSSVRIF